MAGLWEAGDPGGVGGHDTGQEGRGQTVRPLGVLPRRLPPLKICGPEAPASPLFSDPRMPLKERKFLFVFKRGDSRHQDKLVGDIWRTSKPLLPLVGCVIPAWPLSLRGVLWEAFSFLNSLVFLPLLSRDSSESASSRMPAWAKAMTDN